MEQTARFQIPLLAAGQVQKEFYHNEALERISMLLCPTVEGAPQSEPPENPMVGTCCLVATGGTGAWSGHDGAIACFTEGGWRFVNPIEGLSVTDRASGEPRNWRAGTWEAGVLRASEVRINGQPVLRQRQPEIAEPSGGGLVDDEARTAISAMLAALRAHGLIE